MPVWCVHCSFFFSLLAHISLWVVVVVVDLSVIAKSSLKSENNKIQNGCLTARWALCNPFTNFCCIIFHCAGIKIFPLDSIGHNIHLHSESFFVWLITFRCSDVSKRETTQCAGMSKSFAMNWYHFNVEWTCAASGISLFEIAAENHIYLNMSKLRQNELVEKSRASSK